jgi:hypothetical protein
VTKQRAGHGETREEKQKDKTAKLPDRDLQKLRGYETKHKNRQGMLAELDRRIASA